MKKDKDKVLINKLMESLDETIETLDYYNGLILKKNGYNSFDELDKSIKEKNRKVAKSE